MLIGISVDLKMTEGNWVKFFIYLFKVIHLNFNTSSNLSLIQFNSMCLTFKHLFKHLANKGHSTPVLVAGLL